MAKSPAASRSSRLSASAATTFLSALAISKFLPNVVPTVAAESIAPSAFVRVPAAPSRPSATKGDDARPFAGAPLRDINGWRDQMFDLPGSSSATDSAGMRTDTGPPPREVCVLPFPYTDVLLQGETKQLRLYEERFIKLFEECLNDHSGVVAMGLLAESGIIQTVPLCEVEAYNTVDMFGSPSIFCTIRAVGRASLLELTQQEPYIKAVCVETMDTVPPNLELPSVVAGNVENFIVAISSLEHRLELASGRDRVEIAGEDMDDDDNDAEDGMDDRIRRAQLEDAFYSDDEDDEEEEEEDDDDDDEMLDRAARFREAFRLAKSTDTQGYTVSSPTMPATSTGAAAIRSAQDLTAISWAAFSTDPPMDTHGEAINIIVDEDGNEYEGVPLQPTAKSITYRIQALDSNDLFERLKLASFMLRERRDDLKAEVADLEGKGGRGKKGGEEGELPDEDL